MATYDRCWLRNMRRRPTNESGGRPEVESWRQRIPWLGPPPTLGPGFRQRISVHPRRRGVKRRDLQPQMCRECTIIPCRDRAPSSLRWPMGRDSSSLGSRRKWRGEYRTASTTRRSKRMRTISFRSRARSMKDTGYYSRPTNTKCRLCPNSGFRKWDDFQPHCKTTEAHPIDICSAGCAGTSLLRLTLSSGTRIDPLLNAFTPHRRGLRRSAKRRRGCTGILWRGWSAA